jgi:hypothetical protein
MAGWGVPVCHRVAGAGAGREIPERCQPAIGFGDGEGADIVLLGEATHRRQQRAGPQGPAVHERGDAGDDLFGQRLAASAAANKVQVEHATPARERNLYSVAGTAD